MVRDDGQMFEITQNGLLSNKSVDGTTLMNPMLAEGREENQKFVIVKKKDSYEHHETVYLKQGSSGDMSIKLKFGYEISSSSDPVEKQLEFYEKVNLS